MTRTGIFALPRLLRPLAVRARQLFPAKPGAGSSYTCLALTGRSDYNICINADLSVSCYCGDFDGAGHIGNLNETSYEEIFTGPRVAAFLKTLKEGRFPLKNCAHCIELKELDSPDEFVPGAVPSIGIMIENTAACNYRCAFCDRETLLKTRSRTTISLEDLEKVAAELALHPPKLISYFNLGEPFLSAHILDEMRILKRNLPQTIINTSTNAAVLSGEDKIEAALLMDSVVFSIDGTNQENLARYQERGDFNRAYANMKALVAARNARRVELDDSGYGPYLDWKYVLFKWNDSPSEIAEAIRLAEEAGVDSLTFIPGTTEAKNVSLRYFSDKTLEERAEFISNGRAIRFSPAPSWLQ